MIDDAAEKALKVSQQFDQVVDIPSAVRILGITEQAAKEKKIVYEAKHIAEAKECRTGCTDNGAKAVQAISTLLTGAGGFLAVANPSLGIFLTTLGGVGSVLGALFAEESSSGLRIEQVHEAVLSIMQEIHLTKDLHNMKAVGDDAAAKTRSNGKLKALLEKNKDDQKLVDSLVRQWATSYGYEWSFWKSVFVDLDTKYRQTYSAQSSYRATLISEHLNKDCQSKCNFRKLDGYGRQAEFDFMKAITFLERGDSGECGVMLKKGEDAFQKMARFAVGYLESASHLVEFAASSLDIMQKEEFCDPFKYTQEEIETLCCRKDQMETLVTTMRRNVKYFFALHKNMREEIPQKCQTGSPHLWPFGGSAGPQMCDKHVENPADHICGYPNVFSVQSANWHGTGPLLPGYKSYDTAGKMVLMKTHKRPIRHKLKNDCNTFYNNPKNRELGFGTGSQFSRYAERGFTDGGNHCQQIACDDVPGRLYGKYSLVATPNYCVNADTSKQCIDAIKSDKSWGF